MPRDLPHGRLLKIQSAWFAPALLGFGAAVLLLAWDLADAGFFATQASALSMAAGGLMALAAAFGIAAALTRRLALAALATALLAAVFSTLCAADVVPQWHAQHQWGCAALQLVSLSWLCWTLFEHRIVRVRVNQIFRLSATVCSLMALAVCALPLPLQGPAFLCVAVLTVPITLATVIDLALHTPTRALPWFACAWVLMASAIGAQLLDSAGFMETQGWAAASLCSGLIGLVIVVLIDLREAVDERENAHRKSFDAARKYRHVYYSVPVALVSIDSAGQVLRWNEMADTFFDTWLIKGRLNYLSSLLGVEGMKQLLRDAATGGRHVRELRLPMGPAADPAHRVYALDALAVGNSIEISFVDVSERSRLSDMLEHMAHHDFLTDKLNRRGLERHIDALLAGPIKNTDISVIYADLDRFKSINDVFGHAAGDVVVVEVARRLAKLLPPGGEIGRIGGDEFVIVLSSIDFDDVNILAGQILNAIACEAYDFEGTRLEIEASIGVVSATDNMNTRELIGHADDACAQSKRSGRGKITSLRTTRESLNNYRTELYYGTQLKSSLPVDQLRLYAQPIVALRGDTSAMSYEVLLRTQDEHGHVRTPNQLLAAAERQGAMSAIDRFVLRSSLEHLSAHRDFVDDLGFVSINMSGMSLNDDAFVRDAVAMIKAHPAVAPVLCLEITESIALYDMKNTRRFVDQMRSIGVSVALDDFGAGYTSFAYLKELPASLVKIDGQFILDIARDTKQRGIVRAIQQLSGELGMLCLAEWVEDVATLRTLLELDIDYAQGFVLARPQPFSHWLTHSVDLAPLNKARRGMKRSQLPAPVLSRLGPDRLEPIAS